MSFSLHTTTMTATWCSRWLVLNKRFTFKLSTRSETIYFIADSEKEKEDWINSIRRSIVQHSRSVTDNETVDYDNKTGVVELRRLGIDPVVTMVTLVSDGWEGKP
ncbi:pleckstrin homology (PH) domain superfamily protein [Actinidia rufa]|uniref:Pleckstrin homology (PH) domain superfamily protein n=1 Tax=Actinidia rufa TaxID=165716 RepID=A0A7J0H132_9ERIC|nr:pleckstrin homology (PH) domain superfamily protein [Actinidia rufa]